MPATIGAYERVVECRLGHLNGHRTDHAPGKSSRASSSRFGPTSAAHWTDRIGLRLAIADTAGSAAAPAARCRNCRRGSFISIPPSLVSLLDHLIGAGEQRGTVSQSSNRLIVIREIEVLIRRGRLTAPLPFDFGA